MATLTPRERQVVEGLVRGKSQSQVARDLGISYNTLRTYIRRAQKRTNSSTTVELTAKCVSPVAIVVNQG